MQVVSEFLDYLENFSGLSFNTLRLYKRDLLDFSNFIRVAKGAEFNIADLSAAVLESFSEYVKKNGGSVASVNRKLTAIHRMWNWLREERIVTRDPFTQIIRESQYRNKEAEILNEEEINLLLSRNEENFDSRTELLLELIYSCGLRVNEVLALTVEDISFTDEMIYINKSAKVKPRFIPMISSVKELLELYIEKSNLQSVEKLFNISARELYRIIQAKAKSVGVEKRISASILRNSFIKHMKNRGAHQIFLQDIMGQKNFSRIL